MQQLKRVKKHFKKGVLLLVLFLSLGSFLGNYSPDFEIQKNTDIFYTLYRELHLFYVDETDPGKLMKTGIDAMLKSLDPYNLYIPESDIEDYKFMTTGQYGGVGASIQTRKNKIVIAEPYENSPIHKAGLRSGDIILEIDGNTTKGKNSQQISELLKGQPKTEVKLLIERPGTDEKIEKTIVREKIQISPVPYYGLVNDSVGYIKLSSFTETASDEVKKGLIDLKDKHGVKSVILDLRDNPGGLLIQAVHIVNLFVDKGEEIVSTIGKVEQWNNTFKTMFSPVDTDIPVVVLVNRSSASASEIVSGALQDLDRAVVLGQKTYGKGLVQTTRSLSYNTKLKVTTAKYYIPSGRCIQALDYSNRNPDGSVGSIPDSLISKFSTRNGREVFDGGGVKPDVAVEKQEFGEITKALVKENLIFDYVTQYVQAHDSIKGPEKFLFSDNEYKEFMDFLKQHKFSYETGRDKSLNSLIEVAKREKCYEFAVDEFEALKNKLGHNNINDLHLFADELKALLRIEIVGRYYFQKGKIRASLIDNPEIEKALTLLHDTAQYKSILAGK